MTVSTKFKTLVLTILIISAADGYSQDKSIRYTQGIPWRGAPGVQVTVEQLMKDEQAASLRPGEPFHIKTREEFEPPQRSGSNPLSPAVAEWPPRPKEMRADALFQVTSPQTVGANWLGIQISETPGWVPPDCMGDVGPSQFLMHVNGRIKVFDKAGNVGGLNAADSVFWNSVRGGTGIDVSDPHVRYDPISGRWFVVIITIPTSGANRILVAMSSGSTISSTSSFTYYYFVHDQVGTTPNTDTGGFADYPTLGVDANALYIGANIFNASGSAYIGSSVYVIRKSDLITGTLTVTPFRNVTNGSTTGPYTPQGVQNDDPAATEGYFIGVDAVSYGKLDVLRVTNPGGTPSISSALTITTPTTTAPISQVAKGSTNPVDGIDDRLFAAQLKKNKLTGVASLWTAHNIQVNSSGIGSSSGGRNGARWYEIRNLTTTPSLYQSGTVYSDAASAPQGYIMPSVAMSGQGHMALGCTYASTNDYLGVAVSGKLVSDALGTSGIPTLAVTSSTAYNAESISPQRWGDYSQVVVDPTDDMTMWTVQEYCNATSSWGVRVVQLIAPPPATPSAAAPSSVAQGASNVSVTLTGTASSGSGFFDPGSGYANRLSAAVNGGGITVNSITFTSPTSVTLNLSVAPGAATGSRTITVTNPDGQNATSVSGLLTVSQSGCPVITISPASLTAATLGAAYSQTLTSGGGTAPYRDSITAGTLPVGVTLTTGGLLSGTPTTTGAYSFTVLTTDNNGCTGSQAYSLTVGGCPAITVTPATLPGGTVGVAYSQSVAAGGGTSPYTFSVTTGSLPAGLTLNASTGMISGTPTTTGTSSFTITATDHSLCQGTLAASITIAGAPTTISLTTTGAAYTQNFNTIAATGTADTTTLPIGWTFYETGTNANATYAADNGSLNSGNTYSYGATASAERAFGTLLSSTLTSTIGARFTNNTGSAIANLAISYAGEEWRLGTRNRFDTLRFQYSTDAAGLMSGTWTTVNALTLRTPDTSGTAGARDGNTIRTILSSTISGLTIPNGSNFWIRWVEVNVTGADDGLAVDDFSITPLAGAPTNPSVAGAATPATVPAGNSVLLTAAVTPGTNPASTGLGVTADISTIGGTAAQILYDDGTHGDVTAGDNTFSFLATVAAGTSTGAKSIPVTVTDAQARSGNTTIPLTVTAFICPTITLTGFSGGTIGTAYNQTCTAAGGQAPYTYSYTGVIPAGCTFDTTGRLSGTPSASGTSVFTVTAKDHNNCTGSRTDTVVISCPVVTISSARPGPFTIGTAFTYQYAATGGAAPYRYHVTAGSLPAGCTLDTTGQFSGTPVSGGTSIYTLTATDLNGCTGNRTDTVVVSCPLISITSPGPGSGTVGAPVSYQYAAAGGTAPYVYSVTAGLLPTGCTLDTTGHLSGTPSTAGTAIYTVTVKDRDNCTGSRADTIAVSCPIITISSAKPGVLIVGTYFSYQYATTGGTAPHAYSVTVGTLPTGLHLSASGLLSGTVYTSSTAVVTVTSTDNFGCQAARIDTISSECPVVTVVPASIPDDTVGIAYSELLSATGGHAPYAFSVISGSLPSGITLQSGGLLSGQALFTGTYTIVIAADDSNGCRGTRTYTLHSFPSRNSTTIEVNLDARWNLVSVPLELPNDSVNVLLPFAVSRAFGYTPAGYHISDTLARGIGYWIKLDTPDTARFSGIAQMPDTVGVRLGWNLIGSIALPTPVTSIGTIPPGMTTSGVYGYSSRYRIVDTIVPGRGYWIKTSQDGQIILAPGLLLAAGNTIRIQRSSEVPPPPPAGSGAEEPGLPRRFALEQAQPNPFNPSTELRYQLPIDSKVTLSVYDLLGQRVATLVNEVQGAGYRSVTWNASGFSSGVFFYRLEAVGVADPGQSFTDIRKMVLVR